MAALCSSNLIALELKGSGCKGFVAHPDAQTNSGQSLQEEQPLPAVQIEEAVCQQQPRRHWGADDLRCVKDTLSLIDTRTKSALCRNAKNSARIFCLLSCTFL